MTAKLVAKLPANNLGRRANPAGAGGFDGRSASAAGAEGGSDGSGAAALRMTQSAILDNNAEMPSLLLFHACLIK